jgi:hypothetical protein
MNPSLSELYERIKRLHRRIRGWVNINKYFFVLQNDRSGVAFAGFA